MLAVLAYLSPIISLPVVFPVIVFATARDNSFVRKHALRAGVAQLLAMAAFLVTMVLLTMHRIGGLAAAIYIGTLVVLMVHAILGARQSWRKA